MTLTPTQLERYRTALEAERARVAANLSELGEELDPHVAHESGVVLRTGEIAATVTELEQHQALQTHEQKLLGQIDAALARLDAGTFGVCDVDGNDIPAERLDVLPWATRCVAHERACITSPGSCCGSCA